LKRQTLEKVATPLLILWTVLLLPGVPLAVASLMAVDAGPKLSVYIFIASAWTYPISVGVGWLLKDKMPIIAFLPAAIIVVWLISGS